MDSAAYRVAPQRRDVYEVTRLLQHLKRPVFLRNSLRRSEPVQLEAAEAAAQTQQNAEHAARARHGGFLVCCTVDPKQRVVRVRARADRRLEEPSLPPCNAS